MSQAAVLRLNTFIAAAAIASIFATGWVVKGWEVDLFPHYAAVPVLLLLGFVLSGGAISRTILLFIGALAAHSLWSVALFGNSAAAAMQQLAGITAMLATFWYVLRINDGDLAKLFAIYMRLAVLVSAIALLQLAGFLAGVGPLYDFGWLFPEYHLQYNELGLLRIQSVMLEPAHLGLVLSPAIFVAVLNLTGRSAWFIPRWQSLAVLGAAGASLSAISLLAIALSLALSLVRQAALGRLIGAAGLVAACFGAYLLFPDLSLRVDDLAALLLHQSLASANLSSLTVYNNAHVAGQALLETNLFGGGLGSHPVSFEKFSLLFGVSELPLRYAMLNNTDASALLLRIASELGLLGMGAAAWFLVRYHIPAGGTPARAWDGSRGTEWIISNAALVLIVMSLLRQGHYFNYGLPFFGLLYLEAGRSYRLSLGHARQVRERWA